MPFRPSSRAARWLCLPLLALGLAACDVSTDLDDLDVILQVDDLPVDLGAGITAQVRPGEPTVATADVPTDFDVESIDELDAITLRPGMFTFTAAAARGGAGGAAAPSGTITGYVFVGGVPVPGTPVTLTVTDGTVTAVSPEVVASAASTIDRAAVEAFIDSLPGAERPDLADWQSLSVDEIRAQISAALAGASLPIAFGLEVTSSNPDDPLTGSITLSELDVSATITR